MTRAKSTGAESVKDIDPIRRRLDTARHEVGHVIPLLVHGVPFKNVEILIAHDVLMAHAKQGTLLPNFGFVLADGDLLLGVVRPDRVEFIAKGCRFLLADQIIQAMAGVAGEQIEYERPIWRDREWIGEIARARVDYQDACEIANRLITLEAAARDVARLSPVFPQIKKTLRNSFTQAWELLQQHKAKHAALVAALLDKNLLTYAECLAIWEANHA
jgi:hypothetical protein